MAVYVLFGAPGSGKSTHAAKVVYKNLKAGFPTYSNVDITGSIRIDASTDIGKYELTGGDLIIDEAGIEYNNRSYKSFPKHQIEWYKLYRHHQIRDIYVYSQSFEDMEITLRRLATQFNIISKTMIPGLFIVRQIYQKPDIDEDTHQIVYIYSYKFLGFSFVWGPRYWPMFDSWSCEPLPYKDFTVLGLDTTLSNFQPKEAFAAVKSIIRKNGLLAKLLKSFSRLFQPAPPKTLEAPSAVEKGE